MKTKNIYCPPGRLKYKKDKIQELAECFVSSLSASSCLAEAAAVATEYLQDADSAVSLLAQVQSLLHCPVIGHVLFAVNQVTFQDVVCRLVNRGHPQILMASHKALLNTDTAISCDERS